MKVTLELEHLTVVFFPDIDKAVFITDKGEAASMSILDLQLIANAELKRRKDASRGL